MRRTIFSLFLVGVMLLTLTPFTVLAGEEETTSLIYKQEFESTTLKATNYSGGGNSTVSDTNLFERKSDDVNGNGYGHFHHGNKGWYRIGFQVDENGVTDGKLSVSFRFRPYGLSDDRKQLTFVALGDETSTTTDYITLLGISGGTTYFGKMGVLESNGKSYPMQATGGANAVLTSVDFGKWFTYNAVIDLDTHSIDAEVVREEDGAKYTYSKTGMATRAQVKNGWGLWPQNTNMKKFVAMGPIDIDDLSIARILTTKKITAQKLTFVSINGAERDECSIYTPKARITFDMAVKAIPKNAVTMDGKDCSGGVLSDDGKTYTFDIPDTLISGTAHKVNVYTSMLEAVLSDVVAGDDAEFDFTVAQIGTKSTVYTQDFEDEALTAINYSGGSNTVVTNTNIFERRSDDVNGNGYGRFHKSNAIWYRIGFQTDENGVTDGKLNVEFRFRPLGLSADPGQLAFVGLGDETKTTTDYLTLLGISAGTNFGKMGVLESNGISYPMQSADGTNAVLTSADFGKWFTYNAVVDLDTHSIDVEVVREEDGAKYTYSKTEMAMRSQDKDGWGLWPKNTNMKKFVAMGPIDIDDIKISYMPVAVSDLLFYDADGVETSYASSDSVSIGIRFSNPVLANSITGKVKLDGKELSGTLSDDGLEYNIPLTEGLNQGDTHTLSVAAGVVAINEKVSPSEKWTASFTVKDSLLLFEEDYEGNEVTAYRDFIGSGGKCTVTEENTGNHYGKIDTNNWNRGGYSFDEVTSGKVKISFNYMFDDVSVIDDNETGATSSAFVRFGHEYGAVNRYLNDPLTLLGRYRSEMVFAKSASTDSAFRLGHVSADKWYSYDAILDIDNRTINLTVSTDDGTMKVFREIPLRENTDTTSATGSGNMWNNWPNVNTFDSFIFVRKINVDNINISRYYDNPAVTANDIRLLHTNGTEETDMSKIDPSVTQLEIDFGEKMRLSSLSENTVSLAEEDGTVVKCVRSLDKKGSIYTLKFDGLKAMKKYMLTVSADVANAAGKTMGEEAVVTFTTGAGNFSGTITGVTANGQNVTALSALDGDVKVNVELSNASGTDKIAAVYIIYYGADNKLVGAIACKPIATPNGTTETEEVDFRLTKPDGAEHADILLWSADDTPLQKALQLR